MTGLIPVGASEPNLRYRLNIVAPSVVDVVKHAGGWVFDQVTAGWDVLVIVGELVDDRPLRILGAQGLNLETAVDSNRRCGHPQSLAVPVDLFECSSPVRDWVLTALEQGLTQVALWGRNGPPGLSDHVEFVQHRLTTAAKLFKAQALLAAGVADMSVSHAENLYMAIERQLGGPDLFAVHTDGAHCEAQTDRRRTIGLKSAGAIS